ncbi:MAG: sugar phosphate isomerase/epimerase [Clostridia bacterium]|nr:sugar phosphate isomerase/epimerase [Clostridia bacterium]
MIPGIQVSSFAPLLTDAPAVREVFSRIRGMGCTLVQLQWIDPAVSTQAVAEALTDAGLRSVSVQDRFDAIEASPEYFLDLCLSTHSPWLCVSRIPEANLSENGLAAFLPRLESIFSRFAACGIRTCFHPVRSDYTFIGGVPAVYRLMDACPELSLCLDLYHTDRSGFSMKDLLHRFKGRVCMVHFKDEHKTPDGASHLVPVGEGDIDWTGVIEACQSTDVPYAFVEQETWAGDPFDALARSYHWLTQQPYVCIPAD